MTLIDSIEILHLCIKQGLLFWPKNVKYTIAFAPISHMMQHAVRRGTIVPRGTM